MNPPFDFNKSERRSCVRIPIGLETTYKVSGALLPQLAMSTDLSLEGMRLSQINRLEPGQQVVLTFTLPDQGEIILSGKVVWSREVKTNAEKGCQAGVRWLEPNPETRARLNAFYVDRLQNVTSTETFPIEVSPSTTLLRIVGIAFIGSAVLLVSSLFSLLNKTPATRQTSPVQEQKTPPPLTTQQTPQP